jgi:hypothetical protein
MNDPSNRDAAEPAAAAKPPHPLRKWAQRLAPYVVAGLAIATILRKYPPSVIAEELGRGNALAMMPYTLPILIMSVSVLGYADVWVFRRCIETLQAQATDDARPMSAPSWLRLVRARMAMAPLAMIGYTAGVGGYGVWLARVTGAGVGYTSGMVLYTLSSDLVAVSIVASLSIWVGGADVPAGLRYAAPIIVLVLGGLKLVQPGHWVSEEKIPKVFRPWRHVPRWQAATQLLIRTANIYWVTFWLWGGINAFGIEAPLSAMTTYVPIILVVGSMPVNVAGFGAVQGAWLLLEPWADSGEQVLAFSVLWQLVFGAGLVLRGVAFIRAVAGEIDRGASREIALPEQAESTPG